MRRVTAGLVLAVPSLTFVGFFIWLARRRHRVRDRVGGRRAVAVTVKRWIVRSLERACTLTHSVTFRRPFLWLPMGWCQLAALSDRLDRRWRTEVWKS